MKSPNLNHCFKFCLISLFQAFLSTLSIFVIKKWHKRMHTFSRMPAISQKWFQINRTLKGWRGLRNVTTQKCHLKIPYSHSFALPTHLTLGPISGTFLWTQRDTHIHMFSRMPAISQKWFQINRTSYGWKGLWNVAQKAPIDLTLVTFWPLKI